MYSIANSRISLWFTDLSDFLIQSNLHSYAGGSPRWPTDVANEKCYRWKSGDWEIIDRYSGSLSAPGSIVVLYKGKHAWFDGYFGDGMIPQFYPEASKVFDFLKFALLAANLSWPIRGRPGFADENFQYDFYYLDRTDHPLKGCDWEETIRLKSDLNPIIFHQRGHCQIYVHKDGDGKPLYPWDF